MTFKWYHYTIAITILIVMALLFYVRILRKNNIDIKLKASEIALEKAQEKYKKSTDSILKLNKDLKGFLELEKAKPPVKIKSYVKEIIYIDVNDSTIIESVTEQAKRYREKKR